MFFSQGRLGTLGTKNILKCICCWSCCRFFKKVLAFGGELLSNMGSTENRQTMSGTDKCWKGRGGERGSDGATLHRWAGAVSMCGELNWGLGAGIGRCTDLGWREQGVKSAVEREAPGAGTEGRGWAHAGRVRAVEGAGRPSKQVCWWGAAEPRQWSMAKTLDFSLEDY